MDTKKYSTLDLHHGDFCFSAGHFTIFSATERERLHGHNYSVKATITALLQPHGITFDYRIFRREVSKLCQELHGRFLLPQYSPYLKISEEHEYVIAEFNGKKMPFLQDDILILPITNITLEELSQWFVRRLTANHHFFEERDIVEIHLRVFNGLEQSALATWKKLS